LNFYKNWDISKKIYIPLLAFATLSFIFVLGISYISIKNIKKEVISKNEISLKNMFYEKFQAKKASAKTSAIAIANDSVIKKALKENNRSLAYMELKNLTESFKKYTKFKNVKIHLHTKDLHSFLRVWKPKEYGDYLGGFRKSLIYVKNTKKPIVTIEIGKSGMLLRGIAPVLEKNTFLGSVEFIEGLNSVSRELLKRDIYVAILMNPKYLKTAVFLKNKKRVGHYVLALKDNAVDQHFLKEIKKIPVNKNHFLTPHFFVTKIRIFDFSNRLVGYALVGEKRSNLQNIVEKSIDAFLQQMIVMLLIDVLLIYVFITITAKSVVKPLKELRRGLKSFFDYLKDPSKTINPIKIDTKDEFGEIADFANEGIKTSHRLHSEIMELMDIIDKNVLIFEFDSNGKIIDTTNAILNHTGFKKEELINKNFETLISSESADEIKKIKEKIQKDEIYKNEIKLLKKEGTFWCDIVISKKCVYEDENICKYIAIGYDISHRKKVEELYETLEEKVKERTKDLLNAKNEIEKLHHHTKESIKFASLIQKSLLPHPKTLKRCYKDHFVIWKPKDIVGGDIYLFEILKNENESLMMVIDCTGHGVPGAFVTMIVKAIESEIVSQIKEDKTLVISPKNILAHLNSIINRLLNMESKESINLGFDGGVLYYDKKEQVIKFSGARTPLFYMKNNEIKEIKGDKYSVGYNAKSEDHSFKEHTLNVEEGMRIYLSTDGYFDQLGGEKNLPYGKSRFKNTILQTKHLSLKEQKTILLNNIFAYKNEEQTDDITLIGLEIGPKSKTDIVLEYEGVLTQSIIAHFIDILEQNIKSLNTLSKVSTVVIEMTQNMMKYSTPDNDSSLKPRGSILVIKTENVYTIKTKNIASTVDKIKITQKLNTIKKMDKSEIKKAYKVLRKSGEFKHKKGAGIGFYEIAKLVQSINFRFEEIDDMRHYFYMEVTLI